MSGDATTVLEWTYEPDDLFEVPIELEIATGRVRIESGVAIGTFPASEYEKGTTFSTEAHNELAPYFLGQSVISEKRHTLGSPRLSRQHPDGRKEHSIVLATGALSMSGGNMSVDFVVRDKDGKVKSDSRAERLKQQDEFRAKFVESSRNSPEIGDMVRSYHRSFEDEANCFVYLYEIRDRLQTVLGGEKAAKKALGASSAWVKVGKLANKPENAAGRHRGRSDDHKKPEQRTLSEGRKAALRLIVAYMDLVTKVPD